MTPQELAQKYPRAIGLFLLTLSSYVLYSGFISPMLLVRNNTAEVTFFSEKEFFVGVIGIPVGLAAIIGGEKFMVYMYGLRAIHGPKPYYIIGAVIALALLGLHFVFERYLNSLGYQVNN